MNNVITIDGPVASGKGETARQLADILRGTVLNSGNLYRAATHIFDWDMCSVDLARISLQNGLVCIDGQPVPETVLRAPEIDQKVSDIAKNPRVRSALMPLIRQSVVGQQLSIAEGRDMGTVVFPDAKLKIYLDAPLAIRAGRVVNDLQRNPDSKITFTQAFDQTAARDKFDTEREDAPLRCAANAVRINTGVLSPTEVAEQIALLWRQRN